MPSSSIYIAAPEGNTGKSAIALGILHRLTATVARVGVFRPITRVSGDGRDYLISVLTTGNPDEQYGIDTISQLSSFVWTALG